MDLVQIELAGGAGSIYIPASGDNRVSITTLQTVSPQVGALEYNSEDGSIRILSVSNGYVHLPSDHNRDRVYRPVKGVLPAEGQASLCEYMNEYFIDYSDMFHPCNKSNTKTLISIFGTHPSRTCMSL